jgi:hypothetical protein
MSKSEMLNKMVQMMDKLAEKDANTEGPSLSLKLMKTDRQNWKDRQAFRDNEDDFAQEEAEKIFKVFEKNYNQIIVKN